MSDGGWKALAVVWVITSIYMIWGQKHVIDDLNELGRVACEQDYRPACERYGL